MKKTDMYLGLASYILTLKHDSKEAMSKKEEEGVRKSLYASLCMLDSIPEPIELIHLDNAIANLLAYIVSNGKETDADKVRHLTRITAKARVILDMVEQTPLAEVLDYIHGKKKHPIMGLLKRKRRKMRHIK